MTQNIVFDSGGSNELTVHTTIVENIFNKNNTNITPPNSTANKASGPNDTILIDLQKIEIRFAIDGFVNNADISKLKSLFNKGGTFNMDYGDRTVTGGDPYIVNFEKLNIKEQAQDSPNDDTPNAEYEVKFTVIVGVDL